MESLEQRRLLVASLDSFATTEHVDLNFQHSGSEWSLGVNADSATYQNDQVVLYAGDKSVTSQPANAAYDFTGATAGQDLYWLPQSQDSESLFLGFASYGVNGSVDRYDPVDDSSGRFYGYGRWVKATLTDVRHTTPEGAEGGGDFSMWHNDSFGTPIVSMASYDDGVANPNGNGLDLTDGITSDDAMWIFNGGHAHFSFGFSAPGRYEVDVKLSAYFGDDNNQTPNEAGFSESDDITIYFSIDSVGQLQLDASSYAVSEDAGTASIDVLRVGGSDGRIAVNYATTADTATAGNDYTSSSGTLEFLDGETLKTITIPVLDDTLVEGDETFSVALSAAAPGNLDGYIRVIEEDANGLIGEHGTAVVTIVDNDQPVNTAPTISDVGDQEVEASNSTAALAFTVGDAETDAVALAVTATSSNAALVPNGNITLGGSGASRTVTVTPAADQVGTTTITLTVEDGDGGMASEAFVLTVAAANTAPTVSHIASQFVVENTSSDPIAFTIGDSETAAAALVVTATSSDPAIVPNGNIVLGGNGTERTLTITPAADQAGSTTITVTVTDGDGLQATETFDVTVPANGLVPFELPVELDDLGVSVSAVTADFNGDGNVDIAQKITTEEIYLYLGSGDGTFSSAVLINPEDPYSRGANDLFPIDADADGDIDILTRQGSGSNEVIAVYVNDGNANFTLETIGSEFSGTVLQVADMNGDNRADVVRYDSATSLVYYESQADGSHSEVVVNGTFTSINSILLEDVDGDDAPELLVYEGSSVRKLSILKHDGAGNFTTDQELTFDSTTSVLAVTDITGDGLPDILTYQSSTTWYYAQDTDGSFGPRTELFDSRISYVTPTDLNQDGVTDLLFYHSTGAHWAPGQGNATFGDPLLIDPGFVFALTPDDFDNDGDQDVVSVPLGAPLKVLENLTGENPMRLVPPDSRHYLEGDQIEMEVFFGFPIEVSGTPRIALEMGEDVVYADYLSGSGSPSLLFGHTVGGNDLDLDGVQLVDNTIDLNSGALTDPIGGPAVLQFPGTLDGVTVNAPGALVQMISRQDANPTGADTVQFAVEFSDDVTGVDTSDFMVVMNAGDLSDATVDSVTGSGSLYEVTVTTGSGSGTLGLSVLGDGTIINGDDFPLALPYIGGEVYTLRRGAADPIDHYYVENHADYRPVWDDGEFTVALHGSTSTIPDGEIRSDEIYTYADSNTLVDRPESADYDFTGVGSGEALYVLPSSNTSSVPHLGFSGESIPSDLFASYVPDDARITSSTARPYMKYQIVDLQSSSDGDFSIWSVSGGAPRIYVASSDGLDDTDNFWLRADSHSHYNVGFSEAGIYEVDVVVSAFLDNNANGVYDEGKDAYYESGIQTMVFNVDTQGAVDDDFRIGSDIFQGDVTQNDEWHAALGEFLISVETDPAHGTLELQADGTFSYEPSSSFDGDDQFEYRMTNARGGFTTAFVTLSGNHTPVANLDSYTVSEDETLAVAGPGVLGNDTDADGDNLKAAVVTGPQNGSLSLQPDGSFTYTPDPDFYGTDTFTYTTTDVQYEVTPLGTLSGTSSYALDVNNLNQVSGNSGIVEGSGNPLHAFRWTGGAMEDLGVVAGTGSNNFSRGYAINDQGVVVGESDNSTPKAFRWENGVIANLGTLGGTSAVANDINNLNQIVGSSSNGTATKPFVYVDGVMLELPTVAGNAASSGRAWGISPDGQFIVGVTRADDAEFLSHATLWERQPDDSYAEVDMGALVDDHHYSAAFAVNASGNAVGSSVVGTVSPTSSTSLYHGFVYHDEQMIDIGTLDYLSYNHSELKDINATDQFVGYVAGFYNYPTFGGAAILGELVAEETAIIDLNELIDDEDWTLLIGEGINNGRSIVGYGKQDGATRAYLLTPVSPDNDNRLFGNVATVTVEVTPAPDAPVAMDDAFVVDSGSSVFGNVLFNDFDPDGDPLTAQLDVTASSGDVSVAPDGSFVYTPSDAFHQSDSFTYTVSDGTGRTDSGTVVINQSAKTDFQIVLSEGHADIGILFGDHDHDEHDEHDHDEHDHDEHDHDEHDHDEHDHENENGWDLHVHDHENEAEYHPDEAVFYVGMGALTSRPVASEFAFTGVSAGESFFVLPAIPSPELLFLGLGTEEIEDGTFLDGSLSLRLKSVSAPGDFSMWTSAPDGSPAVAMATSDGIIEADAVMLSEGQHAHTNFGFTEMGIYQVTFQATGTLANGDVVASQDTTYFFKVGNAAEAIEVQNGMTQRSYVRDVDVLFSSDDGLEELLADSDRVQIMKYDLDGENGAELAASAFDLSASGNALQFDFGEQGLGGNRNSNAGDGYYEIGIDADGDGEFETIQSFYRMLGDLNGDRKVDIADRMAVMQSMRNQDPEADANGDGVVNSVDLAVVSRAIGKKLKDGLLTEEDNN
ncbi:choice-of-anchor M domain-containing protein [Allorhodopirellula solitaria]|nr:choice-of-anchor M domain-containing protein [Allorhodopirellula solitaria]